MIFPGNRKAALSITFDDARPSQPDNGFPILDRHGVRATFYISTWLMEERLDRWHQAVAAGHEIGNHTMSHPCSFNFPFSRKNGLETYTLDRMAKELDDATAAIQQLVGVTPTTFAYPCGQSFVGMGTERRSYVPLVAERFTIGRTYRVEWSNHPDLCDLAAVGSTGIDKLTWPQVKAIVDQTIDSGSWGILAAHDVGTNDRLSLDTDVLDALLQYVREREADLWTDTVAAVGAHVRTARAATASPAVHH
ncbi:MAG TPA: polysaccharide deacetylase family protein [Tepidisphaeraceae bacterium]|nr:polysaccharide deacetylase family protein [Tepidisphaeraceae bacterium]